LRPPSALLRAHNRAASCAPATPRLGTDPDSRGASRLSRAALEIDPAAKAGMAQGCGDGARLRGWRKKNQQHSNDDNPCALRRRCHVPPSIPGRGRRGRRSSRRGRCCRCCSPPSSRLPIFTAPSPRNQPRHSLGGGGRIHSASFKRSSTDIRMG